MKSKSVGKRLILTLAAAIVASGLGAPIAAARSGGPDGEMLRRPGDLDDAFVAPDLPADAAALLAAAGSVAPGYYQTSAYMAGSVAVGIVLVESDGGVDPSTEDWTAAERRQVFEEIAAALDWWAAQEPRAQLRFVYDDHYSTPLPTGVEPIARPHYDQSLWIADAMGALGYQAEDYFTRVRDYDNDLRGRYRTDWAFTIFVVDSSADADGRFSNGYSAYAYLGGPFMVMTYDNGNYGVSNMDAVAVHEIGHIFYALDQYAAARQPCTRRSGYLDVENQNSEHGGCASNAPSIMRTPLAHALDPYAAGQVGWRDSDGDGVLDPLDTALPITITSLSLNDGVLSVAGAAEIIPYPSPRHPGVTINTLIGVAYRFDGGDWQPALADDGAFDGTVERYHFTASPSPGRRRLEVAAFDSAGNVSEVYAAETVVILDPVDGGLNTELTPLDGRVAAGAPFTVTGVAYDLEGDVITSVEYRIDGGAWQEILPQDGVFDADYEPFAWPVGAPEVGAHVIEVRAIDSRGYTEINAASTEVRVERGGATLFLPFVTKMGR